ncbi:DUF7388 family protein [Halobacterium zhouii]|uniref:DUF7388 family protein n=1 Tax=Halobacterium zhouii TaxID=2902624 RepID=UPI001E6402AB|nr:luciferase [Halobacterium zhouii]
MLNSDGRAAVAGIDAVALKPTECDVSRIDLPESVRTVTIDYEGREHLPSAETLEALAADREVRVTTPVRADGFDPLGDDSLAAALPDDVGRVVVAGHGAYLSEEEVERAIAPRIGAATSANGGAWVGTEGVERAALATGATQFELLSRDTERSVRALRAAGFDGGIVVYAPTVLADDENEILDAVGAYTARRKPVQRALPDSAPTDGAASGRAREVLSQAVRDYALVGTERTVAERVTELERAGADRVVAYPAQGVKTLFA